VKLRQARLEDAEAMARVHLQSWRESYAGIVPDEILKNLNMAERVKGWKSQLGPAYQGPRFNFVAEDSQDGVVGFASGGPLRTEWGSDMHLPEELKDFSDGEFYAIYLLKSHSRRGVGKRLFECVVQGLKAKGFKSMLVWVLKDNAPARRFYEAMGGLEIGKSKITIGRELGQVAYGWKQL
jgi:GNAT superfamily N-acetyltransferase